MGLERQNLNIDVVQTPGYADYRETPVVFANGNRGVSWMEIPRLMEQLCKTDLYWTNTKEFLIEFLKIHPFTDGNGRTASILYNRQGGGLLCPPNHRGAWRQHGRPILRSWRPAPHQTFPSPSRSWLGACRPHARHSCQGG